MTSGVLGTIPKVIQPLATSTQNPNMTFNCAQERDLSALWKKPTEDLDETGMLLRKQKAEDEIKDRFQGSVAEGSFSDVDVINTTLAKVFAASVEKSDQNKKGKDDISKLALVLGGVVHQALEVGESLGQIESDVNRCSSDIDKVGGRLSKLIDSYNDLLQKVYTKETNFEVEQLKKEYKSINAMLEAEISKRSHLITRLNSLEAREESKNAEIERLRQAIQDEKLRHTQSTQTMLERHEALQLQVDTILSRIAAQAEEHSHQLRDARHQQQPPQLQPQVPLQPPPVPNVSQQVGGLQLEEPQGSFQYQCSYCQAVFNGPSDLQNHSKKYHRNAETHPHLCTYCPARFVDEAAKVAHMVAKHGDAANAAPTTNTTKHHLSYIIPGIVIPHTMSTMPKIEQEERRQALEKIRKIRPDFNAVHIRYWRRITPDNGVVRGTPYPMMVIFYEEYHRELLHLSNISVTTPEADRLLPFLDAHQIAEAKKKVEQGMAPFLGVGTSAMLSAGTGATTSSTNHAGHVPMPRPSLLQDVQGGGAVSAPPTATSAPDLTPLQQPARLMTPSQRPFLVRPFTHEAAPQDQRVARRGQTWRRMPRKQN